MWYCFSRTSDPGMIKIGTTRRPIAIHLQNYASNCRYTPIRVLGPHERLSYSIRRLEQLVSAELHYQRSIENTCNYGKGCIARHSEWYQVSIETAASTWERWRTWIECKPYG